MTLPTRVLYYGVDAALPEQVALAAGPLTLVFEAGDLRYIRLGEREIVRRIYAAVRDPHWGTAPAALDNLTLDVADDHFAIGYDVVNRMGAIDFAWRGEITGDADGTIRFSMEGEARTTFQRNRLGFCVLHPLACAGVAARVEHVDGTVDESAFPTRIAPQLVVDGLIKPVAPFEEMAALRYEVTPGVWAEVRFEGDIFEMEDQRNWTDASYKSYCTPLRLPFPVEVAAGTRVRQAITLRLVGETPAVRTVEEAMIPVSVGGVGKPLPRVGLGMASHGGALTGVEITRLAALRPAHLRVDLRLGQPGWEATLAAATQTARALGAQLEVAAHLSAASAAGDELTALARVSKALKPPVWAWLIFQVGAKCTPRAAAEQARAALRGLVPGARLGGGTDVFFTELNSSPPAFETLEVVCYSINPQVHAFDNSSLTETLAAQAITAANARALSGGRPLAITPVTLRMRFNPSAAGSQAELAPETLPPQVDPRQMSLYGAGWTLGSVKYLAEAEVESVTYYETTGWQGVMERAEGSPLPEQFPSQPGAVFPLYHVLADVGEFAGGTVIPSVSGRPLEVEALTLAKGVARRTLVANLSGQPQQVTVTGLPRVARVKMLDATNAQPAMLEPAAYRAQAGAELQGADGALALTLEPYAVARVDWIG